MRALRGRRVHPGYVTYTFVEIDSTLPGALVGERGIWVSCSFNGLFWGPYLSLVRIFVGFLHDRGRCSSVVVAVVCLIVILYLLSRCILARRAMAAADHLSAFKPCAVPNYIYASQIGAP